MSTLLVGYDLNRPGQNYSELIEFLKSHSGWWHCLDSTWLVSTNKTVTQLRDEIKRHIDSTDEVLVIDVSNDSWASFGFNEEGTNWLKTHL
jgi:hypothetical protein